MSADPNTSRCRILREGYLDVKAPPDSPERILHKAWRQLWVCAAVYQPSGRGEPHLILQFSRKPEDDPIKRVKASRDGLRLFRCKSGSRPLRTWALSSGSVLLIYLAAKTEKDTQEWMEIVRDYLWPPINPPQTSAGEVHEVSLIDDEKSFASGLLGVYGRLVKTSEDTLCVNHPHWQGTQMRWRIEDILDVRLVRKVQKNEDSEAGVFNLSVKSTKKDNRILQFYCKTASTTVKWIRSILEEPDEKEQPSDIKEAIQATHSEMASCSTKTSFDPATDYAVDLESSSAQEILKEETVPLGGNVSVSLYGKVQSGGNLNLVNFTKDLLDTSMTSPSLRRAKEEGSTSSAGNEIKMAELPAAGEDSEDDSPVDLYDHIYEEMNYERYCRSDTVYEEVEDIEDDYVPPMPPALPIRQNTVPTKRPHMLPCLKADAEPTTLRLQKLSESVTEALKLVEEKPQAVEKRPSLIRKVSSKKSKSLQQSPILEVKPLLTDTSDKRRIVHRRAVSEPDIQITPLPNKKELPLLPFHTHTDGKLLPKQESQESLVKETKTHAPLTDFLSSLHIKNDLPRVADGIGIQADCKSKEVSKAPTITIKEPLPEISGETEAEYIDMR